MTNGQRFLVFTCNNIASVKYRMEVQVSLRYQKMGVGSKLMDYVHNLGKVLNLPLFKLTVFKDNGIALEWYRSLGYVTDTTCPSLHLNDKEYSSVSYTILSRNIFSEFVYMSSNHANLRKKQIQSLESNLIQHRQLTQTSYEIPCHLPLGTIYVILTLPAQFPSEAPVLEVKPLVRHPWLNHQGKVVYHESLLNWSMNNSLGRVIKELLVEFQLRPPCRIEQISSPLSSPPKMVSDSAVHTRSMLMNTPPLPFRPGASSPAKTHNQSGSTPPSISVPHNQQLDPLILALDSKS